MKNVRPNGKALLVFTTTTERSCKKIPLSKFPFSTFPKKERICVMTKQKKDRKRKKLERSDINTTLLYNDRRSYAFLGRFSQQNKRNSKKSNKQMKMLR